MQDTKEPACLRLFLDYHGLSLLWSWMVDVPLGATELKIQILATLKILPITNKTVLKDSKILSVVERWSKPLVDASLKDSEATDSSEPGTPVRPGSSTPRQGDSAPSTPSSMPYESIPHKKRRFLQRLQQQEEASSSDGEMSDANKVQKTEKDPVKTEGDSKPEEARVECSTTETSGGQDGEQTSSTTESSANSTEVGQSDGSKLVDTRVTSLASELLTAWGDLKVST